MNKDYRVYEVTPEGRFVAPKIHEGYNYWINYDWRTFDTEEEALESIAGHAESGKQYVILPVYKP